MRGINLNGLPAAPAAESPAAALAAISTDREMLRAAFAALRRQGLAARMRFRCCSSCATAEAPDDRGMVFWHAQDDEAFEDGVGYRRVRMQNLQRRLHVRFCVPNEESFDAGVVAQLAVAALREAGLGDRVQWSGSSDETIRVEVR